MYLRLGKGGGDDGACVSKDQEGSLCSSSSRGHCEINPQQLMNLIQRRLSIVTRVEDLTQGAD